MNMATSISTCFRKYATFTGTASRREYWYFFGFYVIIELITSRLGAAGLLIDLAVWIPLAAAGVRRLHDAGRTGWWIFCPFVNIIFLCFPTAPENNKYALPPDPESQMTNRR